MKHSIPSALFFLLAASGLSASAAPLQESDGLQKIRRTYAQADRNDDGFLDPAEAKRATIPSADFLSQDHDGDRKLSEDEFLLYYRQLLVGAEQRIDADIEREAKRIADARAKQAEEAARRAEAEAARREAQREQAVPVVLSKSVSEKLKRAEAALDSMVARGSLTREEADAKREVLRRRAEEVSGRSRERAQRANDEVSSAEAQRQRAERARVLRAAAQRTEREKLAAELAQLDADLAAGRISQEAFETKRNALIERGKLADKVGEDKLGTPDDKDGQAKARGEAARKQHQAEREAEASEQKQRERAEAARQQRQEAEKQRLERERLEREKQAAEKQRAERERLQREKQEAEKRRKDAERRKQAQEEAERLRCEQKAKEDGERKKP